MPSLRSRLAVSLTLSLTLITYFAAPSPHVVQARLIPNPARYAHTLVAQQFAAAAAHMAALRGVNTQRYVQRFTALARRQRNDQAGAATASGTVLVDNWTISPAGTQHDLGSFPANAVPSPDGSHLLVVNSGAAVQSVQVVSSADGTAVQTIAYPAPAGAFLGAAYSPNGRSAYVTGGSDSLVHTFSVAGDGTLTSTGDIAITNGPSSNSPAQPYKGAFPSGVSVSRDGSTLYVADNGADAVSIVNAATKTVTATVPVGTTPYATLVSPLNGFVYVSNWGNGTLSLINPGSQSVVATIPVGQHPSAMAVGPNGYLYVSDSNSDAISVVDMSANKEIRRISVLPDPSIPKSSSPQGLSFSPDGRRLYVATAGDNAIAVFALRPDAAGEYLQGWIPTAWYPTSVVVSADGANLFVTNGFGMGEGPNDTGMYPDPTRHAASFPNETQPGYCTCTMDQFSGSMNVGTLSMVPAPTAGQLTGYSIQVARNDHFFDASPLDRSASNPVPVPGGASPIQHVIYILKENRTYDQVFGDEAAANGQASLTLFGKSITPNLHALAERFGILDNFYADAFISADGHNWSLSANASDYTEKLWPQDYSPPPGRNFSYPFEGYTKPPQSPGGYLWDAAAAAGISYRDYGLYALFNPGLSSAKMISDTSACDGPVTHTYIGVTIPAGQMLCFAPTAVNPDTSPNLVGHVDPQFMNYDMRYPDVERVKEWKREFDQFVANNNLPQLEIMRLSSDHTSGTTTGMWTPQSYAADNDQAVGQVVDAVSRSKYWASTAIFVVEDDAQNGPDHVDSHRTEALVISPYTSQASPRAEHGHYDTAAMVRTIELILGLKPLSQYDATATPMWQMFGSTADSAPYTVAPETVTPSANTLRTYGAKESAQLNFALPDQAQSGEVNRILWYAIKGTSRPYPGKDWAPSPLSSHYLWGAMSGATYSALNYHGVPMPKIVRSPSH